MKNLKVLSIALMCGVLVLAWCEKANNQEKVSCESDDVCPIEIDVDASSVEIEQVLDTNDEWNLESDIEEVVFENNEQINEEPVDEPMMRKMLVDENATAEEIEEEMVNTCSNVGWTWSDGSCTLEDGSTIAF